MARIDPIPPEQMTPEQQRLNDEIAATRSGENAGGPFALWLRTPELAVHANALGNHLRLNSLVPRRLTEIAILTVARHWTAQYEWHVHEKHVRDAGVPQSVVDAIRERRRPDFAEAGDEAVYQLAMELNEQRAVSDETYARAVDLLGAQAVVDLATTIGFYIMVAVVLVTCQVDLPDGVRPPLDP